MTSDALRAMVQKRNMGNILLAVLLIPLAMVLWMLSWWIAYFMFLPILLVMEFNAREICYWFAWIFCGLLVLEGIHRGRNVFNLSEYAESDFYNSFMNDDSASRTYHGDTMQTAWVLTQFLFCAPYVTLEVPRRIREYISVDDTTTADAAKLYSRLRATREWIDIKECGAMAISVALLKKLDLIWIERRGEKLMIRYPAGIE